MVTRLSALLALWLTCTLANTIRAQQRAEGCRWAIATGHAAATAVGLGVLRDGGNVVDAAVAASLALGVAEPYASGLGGKLVMLYRDARTGRVACIEALCPAAETINPEEFATLPREERRRGYRSVCVPGLPAGLYAAHERWGSKPWTELVQPAIDLAEQGVEVSPKMRSLFRPHEDRIAADPDVARCYSIDGKTPPAGSRLKNQDLADTLRRLATGIDGFYHGATAERIVQAAQAAGSPLTLSDFAAYKPRFVDPLATNYRGCRVYSSPPPLTGGTTVLSVLKAQESVDWSDQRPRDAQYIDRLGRFLQCLYPRISKVVGDTRESAAQARAIISTGSIRTVIERAKSLDPANPYSVPVSATDFTGAIDFRDDPTLDELDEASTAQLVVIDCRGNMVSLTQSLSLHFGACVIAPGTGLLLNDSMSNFATTGKRSVNYTAGGKRPRSTVSPTLVTRDGLPLLALGVPGGQRIPTTTVQLLIDVLDLRVPLDEAFDRPRFHLRRPTASREPPNQIDLEAGVEQALAADLEKRGWSVAIKERDGSYFGGGNAAMYTPGRRLIAVGDNRRTNFAAAD